MRVTSTMKRQLIRLIIKRDDYTKKDAEDQQSINDIEIETSKFFNDVYGDAREKCEKLVIEELKNLKTV